MLVFNLVGQRFLFRDCGPDEIFMSVCVVTSVAIVMFLKNFWPYVIIFLNVCLVITDYNRFWALWKKFNQCVCYYNRFHSNGVTVPVAGPSKE
jgi:hypothetical protein